LATLFFTEMWERFTFYGMRAFLLLFLVAAVQTGGLGIDDKTATAIYGLYTSGTYLAALPGGWIADRLIGAQNAVIAGGLLLVIGNALLVIPGPPALFFLGLLVIVLGVGLLKPNISTIVGELYPEAGARRDAGFSMFYMGINVGGFLGPIIAGFVAEKYGWRWGFGVAAIGMALGVAQFLWTRHYLGASGVAPLPSTTANTRSWTPVWIGVALLVAVVCALWLGWVTVSAIQIAEYFTAVIVAIAVAYFTWLLRYGGLDAVEKKRIWLVIVLFTGCALFWSGFEQAGSSLNLFADRYTDRMFGSWELPASWLQSVNSLFIIIFAPIFSWLWVSLAKRNLDPSMPAKFAWGLILMGLGFLVMVGAARVVASGDSPLPYWLVLTYLLHTFGELALSPVGLSSVTKLAPQRYVGQMMGSWFLAVSLGNLIAGLLAGHFQWENPQLVPSQFMFLFWFGAIAGVVLLLLSPIAEKWAGGVK
jgi:proton-dependent oligopeptide transporter, POT family